MKYMVIKVQRKWRAYVARRKTKRQQRYVSDVTVEEDPEDLERKKIISAIKIQRWFRECLQRIKAKSSVGIPGVKPKPSVLIPGVKPSDVIPGTLPEESGLLAFFHDKKRKTGVINYHSI